MSTKPLLLQHWTPDLSSSNETKQSILIKVSLDVINIARKIQKEMGPIVSIFSRILNSCDVCLLTHMNSKHCLLVFQMVQGLHNCFYEKIQ